MLPNSIFRLQKLFTKYIPFIHHNSQKASDKNYDILVKNFTPFFYSWIPCTRKIVATRILRECSAPSRIRKTAGFRDGRMKSHTVQCARSRWYFSCRATNSIQPGSKAAFNEPIGRVWLLKEDGINVRRSRGEQVLDSFTSRRGLELDKKHST